jgi:tRNA-modifying protein YgfZ
MIIAAMPATSFLRLADWGVIRATGADAASFLHGQLTQDFTHLDADHARLAGYCSPKGRLLASLLGWREGDDILLALPLDTLAATLKRLAMFVMRSKCKLSDATAEFAVYSARAKAPRGHSAATALPFKSPCPARAAPCSSSPPAHRRQPCRA